MVMPMRATQYSTSLQVTMTEYPETNVRFHNYLFYLKYLQLAWSKNVELTTTPLTLINPRMLFIEKVICLCKYSFNILWQLNSLRHSFHCFTAINSLQFTMQFLCSSFPSLPLYSISRVSGYSFFLTFLFFTTVCLVFPCTYYYYVDKLQITIQYMFSREKSMLVGMENIMRYKWEYHF